MHCKIINGLVNHSELKESMVIGFPGYGNHHPLEPDVKLSGLPGHGVNIQCFTVYSCSIASLLITS